MQKHIPPFVIIENVQYNKILKNRIINYSGVFKWADIY